MKDQEARGLVLKQLYDIRNAPNRAELSDFVDTGLDPATVERMLEQLADHHLIDWAPHKAGFQSKLTYLAVMAKINAAGVDVVEGSVQPPIALTIDQSVNVHGSQGVQVGGSGNVQNLNLTLERLNNFIDNEKAATHEKEEAKGLLSTAFDNPLVKLAIQWFTGGASS